MYKKKIMKKTFFKKKIFIKKKIMKEFTKINFLKYFKSVHVFFFLFLQIFFYKKKENLFEIYLYFCFKNFLTYNLKYYIVLKKDL